jgi:SAM-dependent methyltransferase
VGAVNTAESLVTRTISYEILRLPAGVITGRVLDVGCGAKPYKRLFPDCEWVGLDVRPVGEIQADAARMEGVDDASFDTVLVTDMLHMNPMPHWVITECARVLKPGGNLVVAARRLPLSDEGEYFAVTLAGLRFLLEGNGLTIERIGVQGKMFSAAWSTYFGNSSPNIAGFLERFDALYRPVSLAVASKPST